MDLQAAYGEYSEAVLHIDMTFVCGRLVEIAPLDYTTKVVVESVV